MTFNFWWKIVSETIQPTRLSWITIGLPPLIFLITWAVLRSKNVGVEGAWRKLGEYWRLLAILLVSSAILSYAIVSYYSKKYDKEFDVRLANSLKTPAESRETREDIRDLCSLIDRDYLVDYVKDMAGTITPEKRHQFIQAWCSTKLNDKVTIFYSYLNWPQERINKYQRENGGKLPAVTATGLAYDSKQQEFLSKQDFLNLHKSLKPEQWKFLLIQYLNPLDKAALTNLTENLSDYIEDPNTNIVDPLADKVFENNESKKIAWYAGIPRSEKVIYFVKRHIRWLRDLSWTIIYIILSICLFLLGAKVYKQGRPNLFNI